MSQEDDDKLRQLLKASPPLQPPESFYRGVLDTIARGSEGGKERKKSFPRSLFLSFPRRSWTNAAKGLATACVLVMIVLVVREKKPTVVSSSSPPATGGNDDLQRLSDSKEVQGRLRKDISGLVENPSPFEEEDAPLRNQLKAQTNVPAPVRKGVLAAAPGPAAGSRASRAQPQEFALQDLVHASNAKAAASPPLQWKGTFSAIAGFRTVVIRSSVEWQGLWREHTAYIVPPPPAPEVDFGDSMVLGIFDGTKPAAGFAIEIEDIQTKPDKIVVAYRETGPPAGVSAAAVITQPYHLRVIPKTGLPVIFEKLP